MISSGMGSSLVARSTYNDSDVMGSLSHYKYRPVVYKASRFRVSNLLVTVTLLYSASEGHVLLRL
jgi:hypothetical protein